MEMPISHQPTELGPCGALGFDLFWSRTPPIQDLDDSSHSETDLVSMRRFLRARSAAFT